MAKKVPKRKRPKIIDNGETEITFRPEGIPQEERLDHITIPAEVGILPVKNIVVFPGTVVPLNVGREKSKRLLGDVLPDEKIIVTICQKNPQTEDPTPEDLYDVGTATMVLKLLRIEEGSQTVIVHGLVRVRITEWITREPYFRACIEVLSDRVPEGTEGEALMMNTGNLARRVIELAPNIPDEATVIVNNIDQPGALADFVASNLPIDIPTSQSLLGELNVNERLRKVDSELQHQLDVLELSNKIQDQVRANIDKSQREYFLQEQLKAIQKELGQADEKTIEIEELKVKIEAAGMPDAVKAETLRELDRLEKIPNVSPEYNVIRTYLDVITELPWSTSTSDKLDVNRAERILDEDHYDLEKVKRRILEYLAVRKLAPDSRGPILCFAGPPGVGKTSLGQSIARALGRKFIRMSLGGMRDEAELRGHRRTYIGAMPGRVIQEIRKAGTNNPVFMLDELDKVGADFRGDPTSALLEVLDPAQNYTFQDHYLNTPFDLSKVMFIGTANYMAPVPPALRDRMETIELPGYTETEKLHIARKYLVPRQLTENGLKRSNLKWTSEAIRKIISNYTREAGVRELERQIGTICRGVAALIARGKVKTRTVNAKLLTDMLGPRRYENELALRTSTPGVATGLAYTPTGGEIIFVEATGYPGKGKMTMTGQIGDVMRESAEAALSLLKSQARKFDLTPENIAETDIHVHVPAGAVPKDGPSAGVAVFAALTSLMTGRATCPQVAMTGEITLRGLVLPVGGIKEKILAAKRAGIKTVVLPERNRKDLIDVPPDARKNLKIAFARSVKDVLKIALDSKSSAQKPPKHR
ncbi:MAG: endopeptidase La [Planctomycetota bacterium]|jgi:ATP-dependent Lon protease